MIMGKVFSVRAVQKKKKGNLDFTSGKLGGF